MKEAGLVMMAKVPEPGKVKTRLGLEARDAADLYGAFLEDLARLHRNASYDLVLAVHPGEQAADLGRRLEIPRTLGQEGRDLGERLETAIRSVLRDHRKVAVIGSDLPTLAPVAVEAAFLALEAADLVVGPAHDGGYYLIAMKRELPVFRGISWSTSAVLEETLERARALGLGIHLLGVRRDIDTGEDLDHLLLEDLPSLAPSTRKILLGIRHRGTGKA